MPSSGARATTRWSAPAAATAPPPAAATAIPSSTWRPAAATASSSLTANRDEGFLVGGEAGVDPGRQASCKRTDAGEAPVHQCASHPGRGRFVRSGAVEDELAVERQTRQTFVDLRE